MENSAAAIIAGSTQRQLSRREIGKDKGVLQCVAMNTRILRRFLREAFLPKSYRLKLDAKRIEREYRQALCRAGNDKEDMDDARFGYYADSFANYEEREVFITEKLLEEAERYRVQIPRKPKWTHETGFEETEDWDGVNELYLTKKASGKLEEEIEKKKKWRRERWAFVIQCASAAVTVIGTMSGWIAFFLK